MNEKKNKHMTLDDRLEIQECLGKNMTFKTIAKRIGKDPTTISKEVKLRGKTYTNSFTKTDECCPRLLKAPFVCNGCRERNHRSCIYPRRKYTAHEAQKEYETVLVESREGIPLSNAPAFENDGNGNRESLLFFCDPNAPQQKPHVENNHTLFRDIVPSGTSFDGFSQETVNLIFSHINAVKRKQFNGKSAYNMFSFAYSEHLANLLGISCVDPRKVCQSPKLLK